MKYCTMLEGVTFPGCRRSLISLLKCIFFFFSLFSCFFFLLYLNQHFFPGVKAVTNTLSSIVLNPLLSTFPSFQRLHCYPTLILPIISRDVVYKLCSSREFSLLSDYRSNRQGVKLCKANGFTLGKK